MNQHNNANIIFKYLASGFEPPDLMLDIDLVSVVSAPPPVAAPS